MVRNVRISAYSLQHNNYTVSQKRPLLYFE